MKRFPLSSAPKSPGIYILRNEKTGHAYIGQSVNLRRRLQEWRGVMGNKVGKANIDFMAAVLDTGIEDWEFVIVRETSDISELDTLERRAISHTRARLGDKCLNRDKQQIEAQKTIRFGCVRKSVVLGPAGPMSYRQIANHYEIKTATVGRKLAKLRARGLVKMTLLEYASPPRKKHHR